jgi:hypothetical protein
MLIARGYCVDALRCLVQSDPSEERDLLAFAIEVTMHGPTRRASHIAHPDTQAWRVATDFLRSTAMNRASEARETTSAIAEMKEMGLDNDLPLEPSTCSSVQALQQSTCENALAYIILAWNAVYTAALEDRLEDRLEALSIVQQCLDKNSRLKDCRAIMILENVIRLLRGGNLRRIAFHWEELNTIGHRRFATMLEHIFERCASRGTVTLLPTN